MKRLFATVPLLLAITALALVATGCGSSPEAIPTGTYATTIAEADIPASFPAEVVPVVLGEWNIQFTDGDRYIVTKAGEVAIEGRYTSSADQVVLTDETGQFACTTPPDKPTGMYQWALEEELLTFTATEDNCFGRRLVLTAHPWSSR